MVATTINPEAALTNQAAARGRTCEGARIAACVTNRGVVRCTERYPSRWKAKSGYGSMSVSSATNRYLSVASPPDHSERIASIRIAPRRPGVSLLSRGKPDLARERAEREALRLRGRPH